MRKSATAPESNVSIKLLLPVHAVERNIPTIGAQAGQKETDGLQKHKRCWVEARPCRTKACMPKDEFPSSRARREALLPDSLGFSAVMRLASTSTGCAERHAGLNVHVWPPKATRRSPSPYTFNTFPTWPSTWERARE